MPHFFFLAIGMIYVPVNVYIYLHGYWALSVAGTAWRAVYTAAFFTCALSFFAARILEKLLGWQTAAFLSNIGGWWLLLLLYMLAACVLTDLIRLLNHYIGFYPAIVKDNYACAKLICFGIIFLLLAILSVTGYSNASQTKVVSLNIEISKKQSSLDSMRIVAISDIHLGEVIRKHRLQHYVELVNAQQPDIILIVGDLVDHHLNSVRKQKMEEDLRLLKARYGCYAVLGNHDYFDSAEGTLHFMRDAGIVSLCDTSIVVDSCFILAGRSDYSDKQRKPLSAIIDSTATLPVFLLDHQPPTKGQTTQSGADLQLFGHTHGGQIFPITYLVKLIYGKQAYGYLQISEKRHSYTSSGVGVWGAPLRLGSQSEIVRIDLKLTQD